MEPYWFFLGLTVAPRTANDGLESPTTVATQFNFLSLGTEDCANERSRSPQPCSLPSLLQQSSNAANRGQRKRDHSNITEGWHSWCDIEETQGQSPVTVSTRRYQSPYHNVFKQWRWAASSPFREGAAMANKTRGVLCSSGDGQDSIAIGCPWPPYWKRRRTSGPSRASLVTGCTSTQQSLGSKAFAKHSQLREQQHRPSEHSWAGCCSGVVPRRLRSRPPSPGGSEGEGCRSRGRSARAPRGSGHQKRFAKPSEWDTSRRVRWKCGREG